MYLLINIFYGRRHNISERMRLMALPQPDRISGVAPAHVRHKPEQTLLHKLVEQYWPEFLHTAE
jgi:hypothetical protein